MRTFGHQRPVRDDQKHVVEMTDSPVSAITRDELGGQFGRDKRRRVNDVIHQLLPARLKRRAGFLFLDTRIFPGVQTQKP